MQSAAEYRSLVDLRSVARSHRRRTVIEALDFERSRESALRAEIEEVVAELEGPDVDEETFARMRPEDADIVRRSLLGADDGFEEQFDEEWPSESEESEAEADREAQLAEVARLEEEIAESQRRQEAFERYLEALDGAAS
jgi:hypothetical protein